MAHGPLVRISGVCFDVTYLMINQCLFSTFKCKNFLFKIITNAALKEVYFQSVWHTFKPKFKTSVQHFIYIFYISILIKTIFLWKGSDFTQFNVYTFG